MAFRALLAAALLLLASIPATGGEAVIASVPSGECTLSLEAAENWPTLRLRAGHPEHRPCFIDKESMVRVLSQAFAEPPLNWLHGYSPRLRSAGSSITPGSSNSWHCAPRATRDGMSPRGNRSRSTSTATWPMFFHPRRSSWKSRPLCANSATGSPVSVEKVLVGSFENVPQLEGPRRKGKIPFDAQVWFRLERFYQGVEKPRLRP